MYFMKSPPIQHPDDVARNITEQYIAGEYNQVVKPADDAVVPMPEPTKKAPQNK